MTVQGQSQSICQPLLKPKEFPRVCFYFDHYFYYIFVSATVSSLCFTK